MKRNAIVIGSVIFLVVALTVAVASIKTPDKTQQITELNNQVALQQDILTKRQAVYTEGLLGYEKENADLNNTIENLILEGEELQAKISSLESKPLVFPQPRRFSSLEELEHYREDKLVCRFNGGVFRMPTEQYSPKEDCKDVAETWVRWMWEDGFYAYEMSVMDGYTVNDVKVSERDGLHKGVAVMIGDDEYFLDTASPFEITYVANDRN